MSKKRKFQCVAFALILVAMPFGLGCKTLLGLANSMFKKPTMQFVKANIKDVNFQSLGVDFQFKVHNPNSIGISLANMDYQLNVEGNKFTSGRSNKEMALKANGYSPLSIPVTINFKQLSSSLLSFFQKKDDIALRLKSNFGVKTPIGVIPFSFDRKVKAPLPKIPEVSLQEVKLVKLDMPSVTSVLSGNTGGAKLNFLLKMKHRGRFPVKLQGLAYKIKVASVSVLNGQTATKPLGSGKEQLVNIPVDVRLAKVGIAALRSISSGKLDFSFNGALDLGAFKLPLSFGPKDASLKR